MGHREKNKKHKRNLGELRAASLIDCAPKEAGTVCFSDFITRGLCHLASFLISGCTVFFFVFSPCPLGGSLAQV